MSRHDISEIRLNFTEIEEVLGFALPKSARMYPAWWGNQENSSQSNAWQEAGWRTEQVDVSSNKVTFRKKGQSIANRSGSRKTNAPSANKVTKSSEAVPTEIVLGKPYPPTDLGFTIIWRSLGQASLDENRTLVLPSAPAKPGLYRFHLIRDGAYTYYIGESDNVSRRFQNYRTPGTNQPTNFRLNSLLTEALIYGNKVHVDVIVDAGDISINGESRPLALADRAMRRMMENAALIGTRKDEQIVLLNK